MAVRLKDIDTSAFGRDRVPELLLQAGEAKGRGVAGILGGVARGLEGYHTERVRVAETKKRDERDNRDFLERQAARQADDDRLSLEVMTRMGQRSQDQANKLNQLIDNTDPNDPQYAVLKQQAKTLLDGHEKLNADAMEVAHRYVNGAPATAYGVPSLGSGTNYGAAGAKTAASFPPLDQWAANNCPG